MIRTCAACGRRWEDATVDDPRYHQGHLLVVDPLFRSDDLRIRLCDPCFRKWSADLPYMEGCRWRWSRGHASSTAAYA